MNNLGKLFKKKLEEQEFNDVNKHWTSLETRLNKAMPVNKKRNKFFYWIFPVLGFLCFSFYLSNQSKTKLYNSSNKQTKLPVESNENSSSNLVKKVNSNVKKFTTNNNSSSINNSIAKKTKTNNAVSNNTFALLVSTNTNLSNEENNNSLSRVDTRKEIQNSTDYVNSETKSIYKEDNENFDKTINKENVSVHQENLVSAANKLDTGGNENVVSVKNETEISVQTNLNTILSQEILAINVKNDSVDIAPGITKIEPLLNENKEIDLPYAKRKVTFNATLYGGAMYAFKKVSDNNNLKSDYLNRRKSEEKNTMSSTFGLDANFEYKNWIFTTGINYHKQGEERNYTNNFYRQIDVNDPYWEKINRNVWQQYTGSFTTTQVLTSVTTVSDTISYFDVNTGTYTSAIVNNQNITVIGTQNINHTYVDSNYVSITDSTQKFRIVTKETLISDPNQLYLTGKNSISYIEIPLLLGYQVKLNRLNFAVKSGIGFGFLNQTKTYYLTNNVSSITEFKSENYNKIVYNYLLRISAMYNFYKGWGLVFEPNFRANINNVTNKNSSFNQKYWNLGGNLGVNYRF
jgi:hypothetical protein